MLLVDLLALKYDSAIKQSIADRTGDTALKMQASMEQSVADSLGARQAMFPEAKQIHENPPDPLLPSDLAFGNSFLFILHIFFLKY